MAILMEKRGVESVSISGIGNYPYIFRNSNEKAETSKGYVCLLNQYWKLFCAGAP